MNRIGGGNYGGEMAVKGRILAVNKETIPV